MSRDDLSRESYRGVIIEAEIFHYNLTWEFANIAACCANEKDYLDRAKELICEIRNFDNGDIDDMFLGVAPDKRALDNILDRILINIAEVETIPENQRHYDF